MKLCSKKYLLLFTLAVLIAFPVVFSGVFLEEHEHHCIGDGCLVCLQIKTSKSLQKALKITDISFTFQVFQYQPLIKYSDFYIHSDSQIILKVRFNT